MSTKLVKESDRENSSLFLCRFIDMFVFSILCLFPLVFTDKYFNILPTKYYFYISMVIMLWVALVSYAIVKHEQVKKYCTVLKAGEFVKTFTVSDIALLLFLVVAIISTLGSDYVYESFWGNEGRYSGLFLLLVYGSAYFCVTRFGRFRKWYFDAFLIVSMLVCLFGITDYFQLDILNFKENMVPEQLFMFTSTLGNINTYTAFVGMVSAVSAVLYSQEKNTNKMIFYYFCMIISFFAIIMGLSDNAYISLAVLFCLLPLYTFRNKVGVKRYLVIIASFFSVVQCIGWINVTMAGRVFGIDSAFNIIVTYKGLIFIVLAMWFITGALYFIDNKKGEEFKINGCLLRFVWLAILAIIAIVFCYILYDANIAGNTEKYRRLSNYVVFDDEWGTHRGYIWRNAMECYKEFSPFKKIFGFGPDTFGIVMLGKTYGNIYGEIYDNAHNEYIHYLITVGISGLLCYIMFLGAFVVRAVRKGIENPYIMATVFAVLCYAIQAFVNLNLPIATPIMWMLLTLGALGCKKEKHRG